MNKIFTNGSVCTAYVSTIMPSSEVSTIRSWLKADAHCGGGSASISDCRAAAAAAIAAAKPGS